VCVCVFDPPCMSLDQVVYGFSEVSNSVLCFIAHTYSHFSDGRQTSKRDKKVIIYLFTRGQITAISL